MSIETELSALRSEFLSLPDGFAQYAYLVELSQLLPPPEDSLRQGLNAYHGCQSQVWLRVRVEGGRFYLDADSDTLIIRGVLVLFRELLDGQPAEEVLAADFDLLSKLGIEEQFSAQRVGSIAGLLPELKKRLRRLLTGPADA